MSWDGSERREGMREVTASLNEIKLQLARMEPSVALIEKHNKTLYGNGQEGLTTKVDHIRGIRDDLQAHSVVDRWMFGILITMMGATVFRLFIK